MLVWERVLNPGTKVPGLAPCCWCRDFPLSFPFAGALGFAGGLAVKNPPADAGDIGLIPGLGRSPGEGNDNPLQYSCLENPMVRGLQPGGLQSTESKRFGHD